MSSEWVEWHQDYDDPGSTISKRLRAAQQAIRDALDRAPPGPIRLLSLCAGDGRDVLGVLPGHPRARDVRGRLVDLDPELVQRGRERIRTAGLGGLEFVQADASLPGPLAGAIPADLLLLCGIFGNLEDDDLHQFVLRTPELCAPGAAVVWTRHRREPDLTPAIRGWFRDAGFEEVEFCEVPGCQASVAVDRLVSSPARLQPEKRLFSFLPKALEARRALRGSPGPAEAPSRGSPPSPPSS